MSVSAFSGKAVAIPDDKGKPVKSGTRYSDALVDNLIAQARALFGKTTTHQSTTTKMIEDTHKPTDETILPPVDSKLSELKLFPRKVESDEDLTELFMEDDDDDDDDEDEEPLVCDVCLKEEEHCTLDCPFLDSVPDPKHTKLGFDYMIICKCHHQSDAHAADDDDWEAVAALDPLAMMTFHPVGQAPNPITDFSQVQTVKSFLIEHPEYSRYYGHRSFTKA